MPPLTVQTLSALSTIFDADGIVVPLADVVPDGVESGVVDPVLEPISVVVPVVVVVPVLTGMLVPVLVLLPLPEVVEADEALEVSAGVAAALSETPTPPHAACRVTAHSSASLEVHRVRGTAIFIDRIPKLRLVRGSSCSRRSPRSSSGK
jgi:hypothetical protein